MALTQREANKEEVRLLYDFLKKEHYKYPTEKEFKDAIFTAYYTNPSCILILEVRNIICDDCKNSFLYHTTYLIKEGVVDYAYISEFEQHIIPTDDEKDFNNLNFKLN